MRSTPWNAHRTTCGHAHGTIFPILTYLRESCSYAVCILNGTKNLHVFLRARIAPEVRIEAAQLGWLTKVLGFRTMS